MKKTFTYENGDVMIVVPAFAEIPMGVLRKARRAKDEADQVFTILETVMGEDSPELAAIDAMTPPEFQEFLVAWTQGAPVGELSSSES